MTSYKTLPIAAASFLMMSLAALTPGQASTETAVTVSALNMRAGPSTRYPVINVLTGNASVKVFGCTAAATWCDVGFGYKRGWVSARYLKIGYNNQLVVVTPAVSTSLGITVINFDDHHNGGHNGNHGSFNAFKVSGKNGKTVVGCTDKGCGAINIRPGTSGVTAAGCSEGTCKGVNVKKNRRGEIKVNKFSFGPGSGKSGSAGNSRGSREARNSGGSRKAGGRRG